MTLGQSGSWRTRSGLLASTRVRGCGFWTIFEPLPETFELLKANIVGNDAGDRVQAKRLAVAGTEGDIELCVVAGDTAGLTVCSAVHPAWAQRGDVKKIRVKYVTLSDVPEPVNRNETVGSRV